MTWRGKRGPSVRFRAGPRRADCSEPAPLLQLVPPLRHRHVTPARRLRVRVLDLVALCGRWVDRGVPRARAHPPPPLRRPRRPGRARAPLLAAVAGFLRFRPPREPRRGASSAAERRLSETAPPSTVGTSTGACAGVSAPPRARPRARGRAPHPGVDRHTASRPSRLRRPRPRRLRRGGRRFGLRRFGLTRLGLTRGLAAPPARAGGVGGRRRRRRDCGLLPLAAAARAAARLLLHGRDVPSPSSASPARSRRRRPASARSSSPSTPPTTRSVVSDLDLLAAVRCRRRRLSVASAPRRRAALRAGGLRVGFSASASAVSGSGARFARGARASRTRCRRARARRAPSPSCRRAPPLRRRRRRCRRACRRRLPRRAGRPRRARPSARRPPRPAPCGARSASLPSASTTKWSRCMSGLPSRNRRRFVSASSSMSRRAPGPTSALAIGAASSTRNACDSRAGGERANPPLDVDRGGRLGVDDPVAAAGRALPRHQLARPVGDVLARHLDEAERRDLDDVRLRPVALELGAQRFLDGRPVLRVRHVDEVDDDDPADVTEAQLADDLLHGLEVVLRDRVLEPCARALAARADEAAGVHVDHGERLGVVEDEVAARREVDPAAAAST